MTTSDSSIDPIAQVDRRETPDRREADDRRQEEVVVDVERRRGERRAKVERRRQIDPTTCERDYTDAEIEFMKAIDKYRRDNGRPFPTWSEVLEVVRSLGYQRDDGLPQDTVDPLNAADPRSEPNVTAEPDVFAEDQLTQTPATPADEAESNDGSSPQF